MANTRTWHREDLTEAVRLRRERHSAAQIARAMGRTRNAVIGALYRAGEPGVLRPGEEQSERGPAGIFRGYAPVSTPRVRTFSWERADV